MRDIEAEQNAVLTSLWNKSKFAQQKQHTKPTEMDIFDFDSTLFMSPIMSRRMWSRTLNSLALAEGAIGPGWWRDLNSLTLGDTKELQQSAWDSYWNEEIVEEARLSIQDPKKITIMLTGRRFQPFGQIIPQMLESKGLEFDIVALRPDPEDMIENGTVFNSAPSVFQSTMDFKKAFIMDVLTRVPSIRTMVMYDDRKHHVTRFQDWIHDLKRQGVLRGGLVHFVIGYQRGFDPGRELACMQTIVSEHNRRVEIRRRNDEPPPKNVEDHRAVNTWWLRTASLKPVISSLNIKFTDSEIAKITKKVEAAVHNDVLQNAKRFPFVGQEFILTSIEPKTASRDSLIKLAKDENILRLQIMSIGEIAPDGIALEAQIQDKHLHAKELGVDKLIVPLWCRPALTDRAAEGYRKIWEPSDDLTAIMSGHFCLGYTYDIEGDPPLDDGIGKVSGRYNYQQHIQQGQQRKAQRERKNNWPYDKNHRKRKWHGT
jgi:hypothetical protein